MEDIFEHITDDTENATIYAKARLEDFIEHALTNASGKRYVIFEGLEQEETRQYIINANDLKNFILTKHTSYIKPCLNVYFEFYSLKLAEHTKVFNMDYIAKSFYADIKTIFIKYKQYLT